MSNQLEFKHNPKRGFNLIIGKTISAIDAQSINVVTIKFTDGTMFYIDAEEKHYGIPVIALFKEDK